MKQNFKGIIFDIDGTLLDSMNVWSDIDVRFLAKRGLRVPDDYLKTVAALGLKRAAVYTRDLFDLKEELADIENEWLQMAMDEYRDNVKAKAGAVEYVKKMAQQGVKMGLATSGDAELFIPALQRLGIYEYFDSYTTIKEVSRPKGFPDVYIKAAQKLGLGVQDCVVFEDICSAVKGARDGGFYTVGIYEAHAGEDWQQVQSIADHCILSFEELL